MKGIWQKVEPPDFGAGCASSVIISVITLPLTLFLDSGFWDELSAWIFVVFGLGGIVTVPLTMFLFGLLMVHLEEKNEERGKRRRSDEAAREVRENKLKAERREAEHAREVHENKLKAERREAELASTPGTLEYAMAQPIASWTEVEEYDPEDHRHRLYAKRVVEAAEALLSFGRNAESAEEQGLYRTTTEFVDSVLSISRTSTSSLSAEYKPVGRSLRVILLPTDVVFHYVITNQRYKENEEKVAEFLFGPWLDHLFSSVPIEIEKAKARKLAHEEAARLEAEERKRRVRTGGFGQ